jgi:hypothetical protein
MKNKLEQIFSELKGQFDVEEPRIGHFNRFEEKISHKTIETTSVKSHNWKWMLMAASIALLIGIWFGNYTTNQGIDLADVSPQMEETQHFFLVAIQREIEQIDLKRTLENQQIIDDAFAQLKKLEDDYKQLTIALDKSNEDKRVIHAMISNFQQRIAVLQSLLLQIDEIEQFIKTNNDEKFI